MTAFVLAAGALTLLAMGAVVFGPRLPWSARTGVAQARLVAAVLRQQFAELEADRSRGLLDEEQFARARVTNCSGAFWSSRAKRPVRRRSPARGGRFT